MADFQNGLISGIFAVFWSSFFAQNYSNVLSRMVFRVFLDFLIFDPK